MSTDERKSAALNAPKGLGDALRRSGLKRRTPLKAKSEPKRSGRIKARRKASTAKWWQTEGARIYGSKDRMLRIKAMPCCVCGRLPSENHHTRTGGTGRKAHWSTVVPLCLRCHDEYHDKGRHTFAQRHAIDLAAIAETLAQEVKP